MKIFASILTLSTAILIAGCNPEDSATRKEKKAVAKQQSQYLIAQPVPAYDWSLERHLVVQLYNTRNQRVATHSVWRSNYGAIEGDCPSMGYGIPYDTSLTNPLQGIYVSGNGGVTSVGQAEPNGIFASTATAATWVMCVGDAGRIEPHYVETKVTVYPYPVSVDYDANRVSKAGKASVTISAGKGQGQ